MKVGEPIDPRVPWIRKLNDLKDARAVRSAGLKLEAMRRSAHALGDRMRSGPKVIAVKTLPLTTLIYPTSFAFNNAVRRPWRHVMMTHRALLVQVMADGAIRNVLFNPTDYDAAR